MTCLNVTVTPEVAWLSTDTFVSDMRGVDMPSPGVTANPELAARSAIRERRARSKPAALVGYASKLFVNSEARMAVTGTGWLAPVWRWAEFATEEWCGGFDELADAAPELLQGLRDLYPDKPFMIVMVGWSGRQARAIGLAAHNTNGFRLQLLDRGHSITPAPATDDPPVYGQVEDLWEPALRGKSVPEFHLAFGRTQASTYRRGLYREGIGDRRPALPRQGRPGAGDLRASRQPGR